MASTRATSASTIDRYSGKATVTYPGQANPPLSAQLVDDWFYPMHAGTFVNGWWRVAWLVLGLTPVVLAVTGVTTWLIRRRKRRRKRRRAAAAAGMSESLAGTVALYAAGLALFSLASAVRGRGLGRVPAGGGRRARGGRRPRRARRRRRRRGRRAAGRAPALRRLSPAVGPRGAGRLAPRARGRRAGGTRRASPWRRAPCASSACGSAGRGGERRAAAAAQRPLSALRDRCRRALGFQLATPLRRSPARLPPQRPGRRGLHAWPRSPCAPTGGRCWPAPPPSSSRGCSPSARSPSPTPTPFPTRRSGRDFGQGYGFLPLVLPVAALAWLRAVRRRPRG